MGVTIRTIRPGEYEAARQLLIANGWSGARVEPEPLKLLIENSRDAVVAVDGDRVVGFARAISDDIANGYLSMLVVDAAYRNQGIGRALVAHVTHDDPDMTWVLRAARTDVQGFYEKLGFRMSSVAMERVRKPAPQTHDQGRTT